jgi:Zn-dependent protease
VFDNFDPLYFMVTVIVMILAIGLHEYCHAKFADLAGDPTPRYYGRVTLNPFNHLDPIGSICFVISNISGVGIGWGRPVMVNPSKMRNPRWDHFISVAAGPLSNLGQAVLFSFILRIYVRAEGISAGEILSVLGRDSHHAGLIFLVMAVLLNISLFCFNLLPIGPLDGHWLVGAFLPERQRLAWYRFNRGPGMIIFLLLVLLPGGSALLARFYLPIILKIFIFFTGISR